MENDSHYKTCDEGEETTYELEWTEPWHVQAN